MTITELRQKTEQELIDQLKQQQKQLHEVVGNILQKKEKNIKRPLEIRKTIARVQTILNEKKILNLSKETKK
jgi:ribosomal protein L29